jgi:ABC-type Fe3+/spermidine/putrescine transport system ATPase subunit
MDNRKPIISIRNVYKRFGGSVVAVDNANLEIAEGEFFALLGPSGCGKTTLLRMLAGFENPSEGEILIDGHRMEGVDPNRRPVNMVFQSYAVFPHMSVLKNVGYGLRVTGVPAEETQKRALEALALVKMERFADRMPNQLSGGQRRRSTPSCARPCSSSWYGCSMRWASPSSSSPTTRTRRCPWPTASP